MNLVAATVVKIELRWLSNAFSFMLLFTQYKTSKLTAICSHCLAAFSAKDVFVQQPHVAKRLLLGMAYHIFVFEKRDASEQQGGEEKKLKAMETYEKQKNRYQLCLLLFNNNGDLKNN